MSAHTPAELSNIYKTRFAGQSEYRLRVWRVLCDFFSEWIPAESSVLDLGCGYCEFINNVRARNKFAMDLNPDVDQLAAPGIRVLRQDCSADWDLASNSLDAVFTSNFFEHLPDKAALQRTLENAMRCLRSGGRLVAMGPNIKYVPGGYWDFFDHYIPLTELSLAEVLKSCAFDIEVCIGRFLPYTMSQGRTYPVSMLRIYLATRWIWRLFGKQFLVVARKA
ncbi:MAG: class I SAM-dependent methyltransferase [Bryobacterales bacterium]|nr:class I SAM-dependent methyltransferase [Bryobacterales bacterium]MBV9397519.1 class I SAM-dependent methyltransferase [Bryobacterales bacterium]